MSSVYISNGNLTGCIAEENLEAARKYLAADDMTQYLDDGLGLVVKNIRWELLNDGYHYSVVATTDRDLTTQELKSLSSWVSGQNSDGLGEGFEQQDFAQEVQEGEDEDDEWCDMISFDWETNDSTFHKIV